MPIPPRRFGKRAPVGADSAASNPAHISLDWAGLAPRRAPAATRAASRRRRPPRPACTGSAITKNTAPIARRRGGGLKYGAVELHQRIVLHAPGGPAARDRRPPAAFGGHLRAARTAASGFDREAAVPACRPPPTTTRPCFTAEGAAASATQPPLAAARRLPGFRREKLPPGAGPGRTPRPPSSYPCPKTSPFRSTAAGLRAQDPAQPRDGETPSHYAPAHRMDSRAETEVWCVLELTVRSVPKTVDDVVGVY